LKPGIFEIRSLIESVPRVETPSPKRVDLVAYRGGRTCIGESVEDEHECSDHGARRMRA
jgi:hypothetical protein